MGDDQALVEQPVEQWAVVAVADVARAAACQAAREL
jgi:hypothetical protein